MEGPGAPWPTHWQSAQGQAQGRGAGSAWTWASSPFRETWRGEVGWGWAALCLPAAVYGLWLVSPVLGLGRLLATSPLVLAPPARPDGSWLQLLGRGTPTPGWPGARRRSLGPAVLAVPPQAACLTTGLSFLFPKVSTRLCTQVRLRPVWGVEGRIAGRAPRGHGVYPRWRLQARQGHLLIRSVLHCPGGGELRAAPAGWHCFPWQLVCVLGETP